jgi:hypothetical protein
MMADDRARRLLPAKELATALLRVGVSGGGAVPTGALAVSGGPADGQLAARVTRLLRPPPGLSVGATVLVGLVAAALVAAPAIAMVLPL